MKKTIFLSMLILAAMACICGCNSEVKLHDVDYSKEIAFLADGFRTNWTESAPEDMQFSSVYCYESSCCSFAKKDIDGDGIEELLVGDQFEDGYQLYDICTFDRKGGKAVHLLSGGERDWFSVNGSGIITESGSSSAEDSFVRHYQLKDGALEEVTGPVTEDIMALETEPVLRYVAPNAMVVIKDSLCFGKIVDEDEESYLLEEQDTIRVPKAMLDKEFRSAYDGKGVVYPTEIGKVKIYTEPEDDAAAVGYLSHEEGYVPDTVKCLGYIPGWFKILFMGETGYLKESECSWLFDDIF